MSGRAALLLPVANSQGYLHQWGTWSTSGYHCPEQKSAAEENRHKNSRLSREEGLTLNAQCNTATDGDNNWCRGCWRCCFQRKWPACSQRKETGKKKLSLCFAFVWEPHLVPALQGPLPLLQHEALVLVGPLDVALADFQALDDLPAVCLLEERKKTLGVMERDKHGRFLSSLFCFSTFKDRKKWPPFKFLPALSAVPLH